MSCRLLLLLVRFIHGVVQLNAQRSRLGAGSVRDRVGDQQPDADVVSFCSGL